MTFDDCKIQIKNLYDDFITHYRNMMDTLKTMDYCCDKFNQDLDTDVFEDVGDMSQWLVSDIKEVIFDESAWTIDRAMDALLRTEERDEDDEY